MAFPTAKTLWSGPDVSYNRAMPTHKLHEGEIVIPKKIADKIALLEPSAQPLTTLLNMLEKVDPDYEAAKKLIQEVCREE